MVLCAVVAKSDMLLMLQQDTVENKVAVVKRTVKDSERRVDDVSATFVLVAGHAPAALTLSTGLGAWHCLLRLQAVCRMWSMRLPPSRHSSEI